MSFVFSFKYIDHKLSIQYYGDENKRITRQTSARNYETLPAFLSFDFEADKSTAGRDGKNGALVLRICSWVWTSRTTGGKKAISLHYAGERVYDAERKDSGTDY